jgi:hypothetical protein
MSKEHARLFVSMLKSVVAAANNACTSCLALLMVESNNKEGLFT